MSEVWYIAKHPVCGHDRAAANVEPTDPAASRDVAKHVSNWVARGLIVRSEPTDASLNLGGCEVCRPKGRGAA